MNNTTTRKEVIEEISIHFAENEETFDSCIEELDNYNGFLGDDRYFSMDEMAELCCGIDPIELLNRAFFGYDAETWHTDNHGYKVYGAFNPNRNFFTFNGYGNFVSSDYKDYSAHLDEYTIEEMSKNRLYIDSIEYDDKLSELFDKLEEVEG